MGLPMMSLPVPAPMIPQYPMFPFQSPFQAYMCWICFTWMYHQSAKLKTWNSAMYITCRYGLNNQYAVSLLIKYFLQYEISFPCDYNMTTAVEIVTLSCFISATLGNYEIHTIHIFEGTKKGHLQSQFLLYVMTVSIRTWELPFRWYLLLLSLNHKPMSIGNVICK